MRVVRERQLGLVAQPPLDRLGGRVGGEHQQPPGARPHGLLLGLHGVEQPHRHRRALVHQRRVGPQRVAARALLEGLLEHREGGRPGRQPALLDALAGGGRGERLLQLGLELQPQLLQVLGLGEPALAVHHPEGHLEVVRHPLVVPGLRRDGDGRQPLQDVLQGR